MAAFAIFLGGALTACYAVAALFTLRFWKRTADGLFATLTFAFALLAVNQLGPRRPASRARMVVGSMSFESPHSAPSWSVSCARIGEDESTRRWRCRPGHA
jgi:hypothetical protein